MSLTLEKSDSRPYHARKLVWIYMALATLLLPLAFHSSSILELWHKPDFSSACPSPPKQPFDDAKTNYLLFDPEFRKNSTGRLSKAVQIDTTVNDNQKDFSKMQKFHDYLESEFSDVFSYASSVDIVHGYGYVIEFAGSNSALKPILLMAHQDTVPVGDESLWDRSPWSGDVDDEYLYGRGTSDTKTLLIGLMETLDLLAKESFKNERTIILAFGYDEEIGGFQGAQYIGQFLLEKYGPDSIELVVDEGVGSLVELFGTSMIAIPTSEKGSVNIEVEATGISGHSSMPPKHTAIGILSHFLTGYEKKEFPVHLITENPLIPCLECLAKNSPQLSLKEKLAIYKMKTSKKAAEIAASILEPTYFKWGVKTSRAIDIISGGNKINALSISAKASINHRVVWGEDLQTVLDTTAVYGKKTAKEFDVGLIINGKEIYPYTEQGGLNITSVKVLRTAFITEIGDDIWNKYTGYLRTLYEDYVYPDELAGIELPATPATFSGNTDTKWMWNLTDHIYRALPGKMTMKEHFHAPNEYVPIETHLSCVAFYYNYLKGTC